MYGYGFTLDIVGVSNRYTTIILCYGGDSCRNNYLLFGYLAFENFL